MSVIAESLGVSGKTLDSAIVERGLRELNADIHFDVANRLEEWNPVMVQPDAMRRATDLSRMPVMYQGHYICGMDRGPIPELKQWTVVERMVEVDWSEADRDGVSIAYTAIPATHENYNDLYVLAALQKDNSLRLLADGSLVVCKCTELKKSRGRIFRLGWRHTFERMIFRGIPGVTRSAIAEKFSVDMLKYPVGSPEELVAALVEE